jgi:AcrR family transcriptional regulator
VDVAKRAHVSRGGQLHHFPHKQELLAQMVTHLFEVRLKKLRAGIQKLPAATPEERLGLFIDAIWPDFKSRTYYAWLELVVASRTDPELRNASSQVMARFAGVAGQMIGDALGPSVAHLTINWDPLAALLMGSLQSLALRAIAVGAPTKDTPTTRLRLEAVKTATALLLRRTIDTAQRHAADGR